MVAGKNKETVHKDFFPWHFKDWMTSGARTRLSEAARSIYHDLLGFNYIDGALINDKARLMRKLGTLPENSADMDAALEEFAVDPNDPDFLCHPRVLAERAKFEAKREAGRNGGRAKALAQLPHPGTAPPPAGTISLSAPLADAFAKLEKHYPNKVSVLAAKQTFEQHAASGVITEANVGEVLAGLMRWKTSKQWAKEGGKFIPSFGNWITKQLWNDHPTQLLGATAGVTATGGHNPMAVLRLPTGIKS